MKKTALTIIVVGFVAVTMLHAFPPSTSPAVTVSWDRSNDPLVNSYGVYYGAQIGTNWSQSAGFTNVTYTTNISLSISNLARGVTYHFAATCVNLGGTESDYSSEAIYSTYNLPARPTNVVITINKP